MGIWSWLTGDTSGDFKSDIRIGRYSDCYKKPENYQSWELSLQAFEEKQYLESYSRFFDYLYDETQDNIRWESDDSGISAVLIQGSQKIQIKANDTHFSAFASIAKAEELSVGMMRRLLEHNDNLVFSHFALSPENEIKLIFSSGSIDCSPYKLYYALKELATMSDKQDNLLLDEFTSLRIIDPSLRIPIDEAEKEIKYRYTMDTLNGVLEFLNSNIIDFELHARAESYLLLDALMRIDYLTSPEGFVMEAIERGFREFSESDGNSLLQKNNKLKKEIQSILDRPKEAHFRELYRMKSTFGITSVVTHERVVEIISENISNGEWYITNHFPQIAQAVYDYIVGFISFTSAVPKNIREALQLYFEITEENYFKALGSESAFFTEDGVPNKKEIEKRLMEIQSAHRDNYPKAVFFSSMLDYSSLHTFARSYLLMICELDMTRFN